jgi:hypothetical protein
LLVTLGVLIEDGQADIEFVRVKFDRIEWLGHRRRWVKSQRFRWLLPRASLGPTDLRKSSHQTVAKNARKASDALLVLVERIVIRCQTHQAAGTHEATMGNL